MRIWRRARHQEPVAATPGWYQSPDDLSGHLRWWDGENWTAHVYPTQPAQMRPPATDTASSTALQPTAGDRATVDTLRRIALPGDGRQSVAGEHFRQDSLRAVTSGMRLPVVTGDNWDDSVSMTAVLRPEPDNPHDRNAVRVEINGKHVGYLPAEDAPDYQPFLLKLMGKGAVGTCEGRLMIGPTGEICVYLHLSPPDDVAFAIDAPDHAVPLPPARLTTVTGEEHHQDVLRMLVAPGSDPYQWTIAELGLCTISEGKYVGESAIEVRLGGKRVGQLTRAMTVRYDRWVRDALDVGKTPICRAMLYTTTDKGVQVQLMMPAVPG